MRITKDAEVRKAEILDVAEALFISKGYDATTISDIIEKLNVARGTVYYHFKSKEDVMDALIRRTGAAFFKAAKAIAEDKSIPVMERLFKTLFAMNGRSGGTPEIARQAHQPQNALMHQKIHKINLTSIPPILMGIVTEGIEAGLFHTPYPYESLEMVVAHINTVFDDFVEDFTPKELSGRIRAFIFNLERIFGAAPGSFDPVMGMFAIEGGAQGHGDHE